MTMPYNFCTLKASSSQVYLYELPLATLGFLKRCCLSLYSAMISSIVQIWISSSLFFLEASTLERVTFSICSYNDLMIFCICLSEVLPLALSILSYRKYAILTNNNNFISMRNSSNLNDLMLSLGGRTESKLGFTTTVKQQVDDIEVSIDHFKKTLDSQRKTQSELQMQLKKLEEHTKTEYYEMHKQISERVNYLTELFKGDSNNQNKEFEYLELQNQTLHDEHDKLNELSNNVMGRTEEVENNVGL